MRQEEVVWRSIEKYMTPVLEQLSMEVGGGPLADAGWVREGVKPLWRGPLGKSIPGLRVTAFDACVAFVDLKEAEVSMISDLRIMRGAD